MSSASPPMLRSTGELRESSPTREGRRPNVIARTLLLLVAVAACASNDSTAKQNPPASDSAFAKLQQRGETVMGVDQYTSLHFFEPLPNGGRIVLHRKDSDSAGEAVIREHMRTI